MKAEPPLDKLAQVVAELEAETVGATFDLVEPEAPVDTLADIWRGGDRDC